MGRGWVADCTINGYEQFLCPEVFLRSTYPFPIRVGALKHATGKTTATTIIKQRYWAAVAEPVYCEVLD